MEKEKYISVQDICIYHKIEVSFIHSLEENGLIETQTIEQTKCFELDSLSTVEKLIRLHQELNIHPEDLDVVATLIDKISHLQQELARLQRDVTFYEDLELRNSF